MMTPPSACLIDFFDLPLYTGTFSDIAEWIAAQSIAARPESPTIVSHINIHNYYQLLINPSFKNELKKKSVLIFDGIGLKIAAFISGLGWIPDLNGTDLFPRVMEKGEAEGFTIYCLGSRSDIIERAVKRLADRFPRIHVKGYHSGYLDESEGERVVNDINSSGADLLIVGMGFITQEQFSLSYKDRLRVKVIWNVGGLFDIVSGEKPRTPLFMRKLRLEWLFRLFLEPKKRWKRNFISAPLFFVSFFKYRVNKILTRHFKASVNKDA